MIGHSNLFLGFESSDISPLITIIWVLIRSQPSALALENRRRNGTRPVPWTKRVTVQIDSMGTGESFKPGRLDIR